MVAADWYGRLAQLVEHLVYTERVGSSSLSPPTILRSARRERLAMSAAAPVTLGLRRLPCIASAAEHEPFIIFNA